MLIARYPEGNRLFVGEQSGVLYSFPDSPDAKADLFLDLPAGTQDDSPARGGQGGRGGLRAGFPPGLREEPPVLRLLYPAGSDPASRISRTARGCPGSGSPETDPPRIDPSSEEIVLSFLQGGHNGGDLHFGPDGMLYISTGDAGNPNPPDPFNTGQDISDLLSSILRIDVDRKDEGKNYAVPKDNPFVAMKGARPEVWAYGLRNPWRMGFDRQTGELFVGDVGWELVGVGPPRREGRQLRLVGDGGAAADQAGEGRADADPPGA